MSKKKLVYRVLSIVIGVILTILTFILLIAEASMNSLLSGANFLIFGFGFIVATLSFFGVLIVFLITESWKD